MKTFWEFYQLVEQDFGGAPPPGGPDPMGGGMPPMGDPMGGGMPPMGGGMPPGGGMGGLGGPPMGDPMGGGGQEPTVQLKPMTVWQILNKILDGKKIDTKKKSGQNQEDMLQMPQAQGMEAPHAPPEAPPQQPMM